MFRNVINRIMERWAAFLLAFFLIFTISYAVLYALDFYPEPITADEAAEGIDEAEETDENEFVDEPQIQSGSPFPELIVFDSLNKQVKVLNPNSRDIDVLDEALLHGVVRHPDSATLHDDGNVFILGHSSYLPNVMNRNFQAFNGIQNLKWGDVVRLQTADSEYIYRVDRVYMARASEVTVPVSGTGKILTLATCNSFGSMDDRYILEATLVATESLG